MCSWSSRVSLMTQPPPSVMSEIAASDFSILWTVRPLGARVVDARGVGIVFDQLDQLLAVFAQRVLDVFQPGVELARQLVAVWFEQAESLQPKIAPRCGLRLE